jgi:hypothetical protein
MLVQSILTIGNLSMARENNLGLFSTCQLTLSEDIRGIIIKNKLSEIKEIEYIYYTPDEIIDSFKSYDFEENLDFYIIFRQDKPIEDLFLEKELKVLYKK